MPTFKANPFDLEDSYHDDSEDSFYDKQAQAGQYLAKTGRVGKYPSRVTRKFNHNRDDN